MRRARLALRRWHVRAAAVLTAFAAVALQSACGVDAAEKTAPAARQSAGARRAGDAQDLIYLTPRQPVVIRLHIRIDGKPAGEFRNAIAQEIFDRLDIDKNGKLEGKERSGIPSPELLRAVSRQAGSAPSGNSATANSGAAKLPEKGPVNLDEFTKFVLAHCSSPFALSFANSDNGGMVYNVNGMMQQNSLDVMALIRAIDADGDGRLSSAEFARAEQLFRSLDANDDETVSRSELGDATSSGATAMGSSNPLSGLSSLVQPVDRSEPGPLVRKLIQLYDRTSRNPKTHRAVKDKKLSADELGRPKEEIERFDKNHDGVLDVQEMTAWLSDPTPQVELDVVLPNKSLDKPSVILRNAVLPNWELGLAIRAQIPGETILQIENIPVELRAAESNPRPVARITNYKATFKRADRNNNNYLEVSELPFTGMQLDGSDFAAMDRDHNGMVFEDEWLAFLELRDAVAEHRISLTVSATSTDPVEKFDANGDGRLSHAEFMKAVATVKSWDRNGDGRITADEIPRHFYGTFHLGEQGNNRRTGPRRVVYSMSSRRPKSSKNGPTWFQKMDRNGDGEVSLREFLGPLAVFRKLDANGDGYLDADEARKAAK